MDTKDKFKEGNFMNIESTKDTDVATITGEGEWKTINYNGKDKEVLNLPVKIGDNEMIWSPWDSDGLALQKAFGTDSKEWIGKKIQIFHIKKKMVIRPLSEEQK